VLWVFTFFDERVSMIREMSENTGEKEQQVLSKLRKGDKNVLLDLYKSNFPMVRNYVIKNNGATEDAEDLLQDALVVLWQNVRKPDFDLSSKISTYLMAVVKNLWLKQLSKNGRMKGEENILPQAHSSTPDHGKAMDMKHLSKALEEIGDGCRSLLLMFYFDGQDMDTIARVLNFANADTAKAKKYQCFKKLEQVIKSRFNISDFLK
jgi:RNA polymerase sigma factor (sigma-70 family)